MSKSQTDSRTSNQTCPECGGRTTLNRNGTERACEECGLVVDENRIDPGPDWRAFSSSDLKEKPRTGLPNSASFEYPGSRISNEQVDGHDRRLTQKQLARARKLRETDEHNKKSKDERNLIYALCEIRRMCSALGLPDSIRDIASAIFRRAASEDLLHGRSIEAIASAAICLATRQENLPRTYEDIATVSRVSGDPIRNCSRVLSRELGLEIRPTTPNEYFAQFCSELDVDTEIERRARTFLTAGMDRSAHIGQNPAGFAAAAIYTASEQLGGDLLQKEAASVADVTPDTIRSQQGQFEALESTSENLSNQCC